jgi:predicted dehydrogenase
MLKMKYNWGIVGTGWIAHEMGDALRNVNGEIYAVCDANLAGAQKYAAEYDVKHAYCSFDELLADSSVDIVYIATPHNFHYEMMKKALEKNKHVFCEKAITVNDRQLEECVAIAKEKNLIISDGVTLLHMPLYKKLKEILGSGKLGRVKMVQVNFGSCKEYDVTNRFFSKELAGGALLDIGVYATSFARFFMSSKANVVLTTANFFETGVDESSGIILKNSDDEMAVMALTMRAKQPKRGVVSCEEGYIEVNEYPRAASATITYTSDGHTEVIEAGESKKALEYEIKDMEDYISNQSGEQNLQYIRDVMATLTSVRNQWGMVYPFE